MSTKGQKDNYRPQTGYGCKVMIFKHFLQI